MGYPQLGVGTVEDLLLVVGRAATSPPLVSGLFATRFLRQHLVTVAFGRGKGELGASRRIKSPADPAPTVLI